MLPSGDPPPRAVDLIETMAFDPEAGLARIERHLARLKESASWFGIAFDRHSARNELQAATFRLRRPATVRLVLATSGAIAIEVAPPSPPVAAASVALMSLPVAPEDWRRRHRSADRAFYDRARRACGCFEVVFVDPAGFLVEGSITTLFVPRGDVLLTPPLARGFGPGVLRGELIEAGSAIEGDLTPADLAEGFFVGNALLGLVPAVVAPQ